MALSTVSRMQTMIPRQPRESFANSRGSPGKLAAAIRSASLGDQLQYIERSAALLAREAEAVEAHEESAKCLYTLLSCNKVCFGASVIRNAARRILANNTVDGRETDTLLDTIHTESIRLKPEVVSIGSEKMQQRAKSMRTMSARIRTLHIGVIDE
jgi:hypothetical protein